MSLYPLMGLEPGVDVQAPTRITVKRDDGRVAAIVEEVDGEIIVSLGPDVAVRTIPDGSLAARLHDGQLR